MAAGAAGLFIGQRQAETHTECSSRVTGEALWTARGARMVRSAETLCYGGLQFEMRGLLQDQGQQPSQLLALAARHT